MQHPDGSLAAPNCEVPASRKISLDPNDCRPFVRVGSALPRWLLDPRNHKQHNQRKLESASLDPAIVAAANVDGLR